MANSSFFSNNPQPEQLQSLNELVDEARAALDEAQASLGQASDYVLEAASSASNASASSLAAASSASQSEVARTGSETARNEAVAAKDLANGHRVSAENAKSGSEAARSDAQVASAAAQASMSRAQQWAGLLGAPVEGAEYSSKHHAQASASSAAEALSSKNAADASKIAAATSASNAATSASTASAAATGAPGSASAANDSKVASETARDASIAAKTASETARDLSQAWAAKTDGPVAGGEYSAKAHANNAGATAGQALGFRNEAAGFKDEAWAYRNTTLTYRNDAEAFKNQAAAHAAAAATFDPAAFVPKATGGYYGGTIGVSTSGTGNWAYVVADSTSNSVFRISDNGVPNWDIASAGPNANFYIHRYINGTYINSPFVIDNASGRVFLALRPDWGATPWDSSNLDPNTKATLGSNVSFADGVFSGLLAAHRMRTRYNDLYDGTAGPNLKTSRWVTDGGKSKFQTITDDYSAVLRDIFVVDHATGVVTNYDGFASPLRVRAQGGAEGGELQLAKPPTGSTIAGDVTIDMVNDNFRVFEGGGGYRGVYVDLTKTQAGAGSALWHTGNHSPFSAKNYLINGCFRINQRGATGGVSSGGYLWDRWYVINGSSFTVNASYVATLNGTMQQPIELPDLAGKVVTVSVEDPSADITVYVGTYDGSTMVNGVITAGSGRRSITLTVPAVATGHVLCKLVTTASTTFKNVQLERGSVASPFEFRFVGDEYRMCQRYYCADTNNYHLFPAPNNTFADVYPVRFPVVMRAVPTINYGHSAVSSLASSAVLRITQQHFDMLNTATANTNISAEFWFTANAEL